MKSSLILSALMVVTAGCSKKAATADAPNESVSPSARQNAKTEKSDDGAYDANVASTVPVSDAGAAGKKAPGETSVKNWDAMVAEILQIRRGGITDDKRARMLELQDELSDASKTDPAAREANQNLSRLINGR